MVNSRSAIRLFGLAVCVVAGSSTAPALYDATADSADRFPFVVEIRLDSQLICSGTVLYPRIVVTAAHCLQEKVHWRSWQFYTDHYIGPAGLSISVVREGRPKAYDVVETAISPDWRIFIRENSIRRFPHDLALIITKDPIQVDAPLSTLERWPQSGSAGDLAEDKIDSGLLVAFGGEHCASAGQCEEAGVRRFMRVAIKDRSYCFKKPGERDLLGTTKVWCLASGVMPGDSGGALLIEADDGRLHYAGVISAQQGLPPELTSASSWRRSVAAGLAANRRFIVDKARELGYEP